MALTLPGFTFGVAFQRRAATRRRFYPMAFRTEITLATRPAMSCLAQPIGRCW